MFNEGDVALLERAGVFHRGEARRHGLSDRQIWARVTAGLWVEELPRVYRSTATAMTGELWRRAAWLWAGKDAALSHQSAAAVWRLDGVDATRPHVTVPIERNPRSDLVSVHRRNVHPGDVVLTDGLRCTGVVRTLFDVATVLDEVSLEAAIESARRRYGTSSAALEARIAVAGRPPKVLTRVLQQLDSSAPAESVLEVRVARLLRAAQLPQPIRQLTIRVFGKRYRLDFAWPEVRLALECDGRAFHEFQRDRTRWRQIGASGWRVLPVTWHDVTTCWPAVLAELTAAFVR